MAFRDLINWERPSEMSRMLQNFWNEDILPAKHGFAFPAIDVVENDKIFKIKADTAGLSPQDVSVDMNDGYLTIRGEKKEENRVGGEKDNYIRREISYGSFSRTVALPESADADKAEASFQNGILVIEVPKKAEAVGKSRKIEIRKGNENNAKH